MSQQVSLVLRGCSGTPPAHILYQQPKGLQGGVELCVFNKHPDNFWQSKHQFLRVHGNT